MNSFAAGNAAFTPSTTVSNWDLDANAAGEHGEVTAIGWGGRMIALPAAGYQTRWFRPTTIGSGAHTPIVAGLHGPDLAVSPTLLFGFYTGTPPVISTAHPGGNLFQKDWNPFAGIGHVNMPIDNPWTIRNGVLNGQICCRNVVGIDVSGSEYDVFWKE